MADSSYLRFPRLAHNLLAFVAEDDVWLAPLDQAAAGGARAWRSTSDRVPVAHPRLNPSGTHLAWTSTRTGAGEAYAVAVDGGPISKLTYWGKPAVGQGGVRGWLSDTEVLVTGWPEQDTAKKRWGYAVPLDGPARRLPYGPTADLAVSTEGAVLLNPVPYQDPAYWKRYLGGRGGQIWYSPDGVALADETAGSDADMGANAFKCYGLGLENHGVDPDHEVPITPRDWVAGRDPQLETAVRLALEALERTPAISSPPLPRLRPETSSTQNAAHE